MTDRHRMRFQEFPLLLGRQRGQVPSLRLDLDQSDRQLRRAKAADGRLLNLAHEASGFGRRSLWVPGARRGRGWRNSEKGGGMVALKLARSA